MDDSDEKFPMGENMEKNGVVIDTREPKTSTRWKTVAIIFIIITVLLLIGVISLAVLYTNRHKITETTKTSIDNLSTEQKEHKSNYVFQGLSAEETNEVIQFMMKDEELNLFSASEANLSRNYIYTVEHHLPDKQDVINYLSGKTDKPPERKARVLLFLGETKQVKEYLVWPIPNPTQKKEAFVNRRDGRELSWASRPIDYIEGRTVKRFLRKEMAPLKEWFEKASLPLSTYCNGIACFEIGALPRMIVGSSDRHYISRLRLRNKVIEDHYLYPLGMYVIVSSPGNRDEFQIEAIYLNEIKYDSIEDFLTAIQDDSSLTLPVGDLDRHKGKFGSPRYAAGGEGQNTDKPEPQLYSPQGQRFTVNKQRIEYLGWSFNFHVRTLAGVQLFNLNFNGETIAYELSIQDIVVFYSAGPPNDFFRNYFDNGFASGSLTTPLIRGVDCPTNAQYIDISVYEPSSDTKTEINDGLCVFEHRNSVPLRRHYEPNYEEGGYNFAFSMVDSTLIVRQIITVWNYDYIIDYEFHQNGVVEGKISSTGYIAVTHGSRSTDSGYLINADWGVIGSAHQHLFNFKIDLDVAGQKNNFKLVNMIPEQITESTWTGGTSWEQMKLEDIEVTSESDSRLKYNFDEPKYYVFYNPNEKQGEMNRGYRIQSTGFSKVVIPDSHPLMNGAAWAKYQLAVSKYSDNERTTASHFVQGNPYDPAVSFESFFENDDSLVDDDLVAWVTVGLHHVPTHEDLPVTTTPGKTLSVSLLPFNFYKRDPSIHSKDAAVFWNRNLHNYEDTFRPLKNICTQNPTP